MQAYADEIGAMFIETSAKDDLNVQKIFIDLSKSERSVKHFLITTWGPLIFMEDAW